MPDAHLCSYSVVDGEYSSVHTPILESVLELECPEITEEAMLSNLCRLLKGQHRCAKVAVDAVVNGVSEILHAKGLTIDISQLSSDKRRKRLYMQTGIYIKPSEKVLKMALRPTMSHSMPAPNSFQTPCNGQVPAAAFLPL